MLQLRKIIAETLHVGDGLSLETQVLAISQRAETITHGSVFFAIRGTAVDAHQFVGEVLRMGALTCVVEDPQVHAAYPNTILVSSTRKAWAYATAAWNGFPTRDFSLVGITGTNGKTTTTFLLREIWKKLGIPSGLIGTVYNAVLDTVKTSELTTPGSMELQALFKEMRDAGVQTAAMEVSSIALDQYRTWETQFRVGVFTNFTLDHLDYHKTMEAYLDAKLRFFSEYPLEHAIINSDDAAAPSFIKVSKAKQNWTFGKDAKADFRITDLHCSVSGSMATLLTPMGVKKVNLQLIGEYNVQNAVAALITCWTLGQEMDAVLEALKNAAGAPGRLERVMPQSGYPAVFVDYAHTDDALLNVLKALKSIKTSNGKIITVFGCGGDRDKTKRPRMAKVSADYSDYVVLTSDNPRTEDPERILSDVQKGIPANFKAFHREVKRRDAIYHALSIATPNDIVLIAGKGHENYQIIGKEKFPFDDKQIVREYYA